MADINEVDASQGLEFFDAAAALDAIIECKRNRTDAIDEALAAVNLVVGNVLREPPTGPNNVLASME